MLALTRKIGERIMIGDNIIITVAELKGDSVRLAVEAPRDVKIYRAEIYQAIAEENKQAVTQVKNLDILKEIKLPK
jgi:carbon storage regulator